MRNAIGPFIAIAVAALLGLAGVGLLLLPLWEAVTPVVGLLVLALMAILLAVLLRILAWGRAQQIALVEARAEQARLAALVDAAPDGWFALSVPMGPGLSGRLAVSPSLPRLLGTRQINRLDDIEQALAPSDAAALHGSFRHLTDSGQPFQITVRLADGSRIFQASGGRGVGATEEMTTDMAASGATIVEGATIHVLWLRDISASAAEATRRTEQLAALQQDHGSLLALLQNLPVPLWRRGSDLSVNWCNNAYARLLESRPDKVVRQGLELLGGAFTDPLALARQARDSGAPARDERFLVVEGDRRLFSLMEMKLEEGSLLGMAVDRTEERALRDELARHIAAHGDVLDQLGSAIAIFGPDTRLKFHNQAYAKLWELDSGWLADEPAYGEVLEQLRASRKLTEEADFPRWKKQQLALFTSLIDPQESLVHLPDGRTLRSLVVPHPFGGLMFVSEDVTHTLALESSYNTLMAVQQETLDNLAEGVAVIGGDGRLKLCNPSFRRLWQLPPGTLRGEPHASQMVEAVRGLLDDGSEWGQQRRDLVERLLDRKADSGLLRRTDDTVLRYSLVPLPDGAVLFSCLDVTDSDRVETALRASNEALEAADRLKAEFIANVSYQLRTPLNAIMGFAEILHNQYFGPLNNRQQEYAKGVLEASRRLLSLVNDILDLATIEAGFMTLEREPFDIAQLVHSVAGLTRDWARKQALELKVEVPEGIGGMEGDEKRLKQALFNLVSNSIKFTPAGGRIVLSAEKRPAELVLSVTDTGIGIAEGDKERVFDRFERGVAQGGGGGGGNGAGLGLSLVKSFVELHGGRVEIDSSSQTGCTVRCHLPRTEKPEREIPSGTTDKQAGGTRN